MKAGTFLQMKLRHRLLMLIPLGFSLFYLVASPMFDSENILFNRSWIGYIELGVLLALLIFLATSFIPSSHNGQLSRQIATLFLCALTPLAIFNAWTLTPGIPFSFGGYGFFLHWLTKYPNLGPINIQVLAGLFCAVNSSLIPAVFAVYITTKSPRPVIVNSLILLEIICLSAVIIKLDFSLLWVGIPNLLPILFTGPLLRLGGGLAMCVLVSYKLNCALNGNKI